METQTQHREAVEIAPATAGKGTSLPARAIFRKEGEYWTVGLGRNASRLKDTKGLGYLAHLLRHPVTEFHVLDLAGGIAANAAMTKRVCRAGKRISKRQASMSPAWAMRARCSTIKPRLLTGADSQNCAKNWKKPKSWETSSAQSMRNRRSMR